MNIIEESFKEKEKKKKNIVPKIILIAIILIVIIIIAITAYLVYLQNSSLKLMLDGQQNNGLLNLLVIEEDGTIYAPIKEIASYLGYESYNGEYTDRTEDRSKCYVQSEDEVANFSLGSNKVYKLDLSNSSSNYEYVYSQKPVKAINGVLYAPSETIAQAFNVSFQYDQNKNRIYIYTLPYLYNTYSTSVLNYGYTEIADNLANKKAILQNMLVVKKDDKITGVIDLQGNTILEAKYEDIQYLPEIGDFLVTTNGKVGILSKTGETKVQIIYDSLELMDKDTGLYLAKKDNKYGVIDLRGNIKIYIEYDEIGIDPSKFTENGIKNKYILADSLIPIKKGNSWALFDTSGNQITDFEYDSFGYTASSSNKDALSLLVIPDYNAIVACKDKKYTLLDTKGEKLLGVIADDIYMTISGGEEHYYISANDRLYNAVEFLESQGITPNDSNSSNTNTSTNTTDDANSLE